MQVFTHFTHHAFDRITERTKLSCEDISFILDNKLVVNMGCKPGMPRQHLLFYSDLDDEYFVAIQDEMSGTIVTILPLEYHANLAWKVSEDD